MSNKQTFISHNNNKFLKQILFFLIYSLLLVKPIFAVESVTEATVFDESGRYESLINSQAQVFRDNVLINMFITASDLISENAIYERYYNEWTTIIDREISAKYGRLDINNLPVSRQKECAEEILSLLHKEFFIRYSEYANSPGELFRERVYNCVTSSIIYAALLTRYNIGRVEAVETNDHVYISIIFEDCRIDVETTNLYGFNPGNKREVLDNLGRITGFVYVPSNNHANTSIIDLKKLISLVLHNRAVVAANQRGDHLKAAKLSYIYSLVRADQKGQTDLYAGFQNLIASLASQSRFDEALFVINGIFARYGIIELFFKMRPVIYGQMTNVSTTEAQLLRVKTLLNNEYLQYQDYYRTQYRSDFADAYFSMIVNYVNLLSNNKRFSEAFTLLQEFKSVYTHPKTQELLRSLLIDFANNTIRSNFNPPIDYNRFNELSEIFSDMQNEVFAIEKYYRMHYIDYRIKLSSFDGLASEVEQLIGRFNNDREVTNLARYFYVQSGVFYNGRQMFREAVEISESGINKLGPDQVISRNLSIYYKQYINSIIQNNNSTLALSVLRTAIARFPNDPQLTELERIISRGNYD